MKTRRFAVGITLGALLICAPVFGADTLPPVKKFVLPNGLTVLVAEERSLPSVTIKLLADAGSVRDPENKAGLANLTAHGLLLGTETRSAEEVNRELDFIGANLNARCDRDSAALTLEVLRKHLSTGLEIFGDCLLRPAFPEEEIHAEIQRMLGRVQARQDQPGAVVTDAFFRTLFPESAYGFPVIGTAETLETIARSDVRTFYRRVYQPQNAVIAVVGDIAADAVNAELLPHLSAWQLNAQSAGQVDIAAAEGPQTVRIDRNITQAHILVGHEGISRLNDDYYAVAVMNYILGGGGFSSRLVQKIRVERGWAYSVQSQFVTHKRTGSFQAVVQTRTETAQETLAVLMEQLHRMRQQPVTAQELQTAKQYLTGSFPLHFDSHGELAAFLCGLHYYDLGLDYPQRYLERVQTVTVADVQQAARTYLHPERAIQVVVGDLEKAGMQ